MENYMDYDFDSSGSIEKDFKRKSLNKYQWDRLRDSTKPSFNFFTKL